MTSNHRFIEKACTAIKDGNITAAKLIIENEYPFVPLHKIGRQYSNYQKQWYSFGMDL